MTLKPLAIVTLVVLLGAACGGDSSSSAPWDSDECSDQIATVYQIDDEVAMAQEAALEADAVLDEAILEIDVGARWGFQQAWLDWDAKWPVGFDGNRPDGAFGGPLAKDADGNLIPETHDDGLISFEQEWNDPEHQAMWSAVAAVQGDPAWTRVEAAASSARELSTSANGLAMGQASNWRIRGHPDLAAVCIGVGDLQEYEEAITRWVATELENNRSADARSIEEIENFTTPPWVATEGEDRSPGQVEAELLRFVLMMEGVDQAIASWEEPLTMVWLDVYDCLTMPDLCHAGKSVAQTQVIMSALG